MIDIGSTSFLIKVPNLPRDKFQKYSSDLFDQWEQCVAETLLLPDYSLSLEVEEGSIKGGGKIAAALSVIYFGIGSYSDFISGLETIRGQVSYVSSNLFEQARAPFGCSNVNARSRKSGGALSRLHTLFDKVQRGTMTVDEAMGEAERLFGEEANNLPEFVSALEREFRNAPSHPKQLNLIDLDDDCGMQPRSPKKPSNHRPKPISQQYRIEIWRESRKEKKKIKVVK